MTIDFTYLLQQAVTREASDLHLSPGSVPMLRINRSLKYLDFPVISPEDTPLLIKQILNQEQYDFFIEEGDIDISYCCPGTGNFRVNIYRHSGTIGIACRIINNTIPTIESLHLPAAVATLARSLGGLILVTGPTGSGKSTTLAAMINLINEEKACHIITLEDPIEYIHKNKKSLITQREIGRDSKNFPKALRSALRQDPDIIMVGEMRDLETISIAVTAAETGHLVLTTLHTSNAPQSIDRIIDVFPPHQQQQIRTQLSNSLTGIISQRLLPRKDGRGRIVAVETLVATPAARNLIREGKTHQLHSFIQTGSKYGMQTMNACLKNLWENGLINLDTAMRYGMTRDL